MAELVYVSLKMITRARKHTAPDEHLKAGQKGWCNSDVYMDSSEHAKYKTRQRAAWRPFSIILKKLRARRECEAIYLPWEK